MRAVCNIITVATSTEVCSVEELGFDILTVSSTGLLTLEPNGVLINKTGLAVVISGCGLHTTWLYSNRAIVSIMVHVAAWHGYTALKHDMPSL